VLAGHRPAVNYLIFFVLVPYGPTLLYNLKRLERLHARAQELFFTSGLLVKIIPATGLQKLDGPVQGVPEMLRAIFSWTIFVRVAG